MLRAPPTHWQDMLMYYEHSAENGDVNAQSMLGQLYYYGARGVGQNYEQVRIIEDRFC